MAARQRSSAHQPQPCVLASANRRGQSHETSNETLQRDTTEAVIGAITGTLTRPQLLILGRHDQDSRLRAVGRTVPLRPEASRQVGEHLAAAGPGHLWTGVRFAAPWGSRDPLDVVLVRPELVAEISVDRAIDHGGVFRHPLRFQRLRLDETVDDIWRFRAGSAAG
ncbi:hypothetical protein [Streptomyces vinaceus]|uniref:hypothetical protein n=1 Tax=Streptomyces vinaceus TaxID=1960 RepID=UPI00382E29EA